MKIRPRSRCKRGFLHGGGKPWTGLATISASLKRDLLLYFPELELIELNGKVHVYRRLDTHIVSSDNWMVYEFTLQIPPGAWLLEHLLKHDSYRIFKTDKFRLQRAMWQYDAEVKLEESKFDKKVQEIKDRLKEDLLFLYTGRESIIVPS